MAAPRETAPAGPADRGEGAAPQAARGEGAAPQAARGEAAAPARSRKSAGERREDILTIAVRQFAEGGYRGTSTEAIAREAGISQPYLFRLFRTKRELFLDCSDRACDHITDAFRRAARDAPVEERLDRMGHAYIAELLPERHEILVLMHAYAAGADPEIGAHVRARFGALVQEVAALAEVPVADTFDFFAHGMLLNVMAALDLPSEPWAAEWMKGD
jgi:AcrR family transcriptional regulator